MFNKVFALGDNRKRFFLIVILMLVCLPAMKGLWWPGYFSVHDAMHPALVYEMDRALASGQFPGRWAPDFSYGYGYPYFIYIYPLPYYLGVLWYRLGFSLTESVQIVHALAVVGSALAMYWYASFRRSSWAGIIAAVLYIYMPYRAVNMYVRGALGEVLAWVFLPLILGGIERMVKLRRPKDLVLTALGVAGLILSHNISGMVGVALAAVYAVIWLVQSKSSLVTWLQTGVAFGWGLVMSMFFWLPAFVYKPLIADDAVFNYTDHFPFIKQLFIPSWGYGASVWGPTDEISFQIGIVPVVVWILAGMVLAAIVVQTRRVPWIPAFLWAGVAGCIYLMNIRSSWIWESLPLMTYFQFPWRWLWLVTFLIPALGGWMGTLALNRVTQGLAVVCMLAAVIVPWGYFQPDKPRVISDADIVYRYFPVDPNNPQPPVSAEYQTLEEESLLLPKTVAERPKDYPFVRVTSKTHEIQLIKSEPVTYEFETQGEAGTVEVAVYAFEGWKATVDGQPTAILAGTPHGQATIFVPSGKHSVSVLYSQAGWLRWINIISGVAVLATVLVWWKGRLTEI